MEERSKYKNGELIDFGLKHKLRPVDPSRFYIPKTPRLLCSSVTLPSQYNAYATCTEFARNWFLEKFPANYFNSVYMDGSKSFDQFRMFRKINQQLKRTNPLLAITPSINNEHNRDFIDVNMNLGGYLRRTRMEGTFFSDPRPEAGKHLAVQFKTILMNFIYKMRVDTRAQQLDLLEYIKYRCRAGMTESPNITLDIHVPKRIIAQIAFDNGMLKEDFSAVRNPDEMLRYLNSYSFLPFLYKRRNATGNHEFFIRVENCGVHIKADMPSADDGDRQDHEQTNFVIEFPIEIEMLAPYCFTYYSEHEQNIINSNDMIKDDSDAGVVLMRAIKVDLPECNECGWPRVINTKYVVDLKDLLDPVEINFKELFEGELQQIIDYTRSVAISPSLFLDFIVVNDLEQQEIEIDWSKMTMKMKKVCSHPEFTIGVYADLRYINETKIHHNFAEGFDAPDSFRTTARINAIE